MNTVISAQWGRLNRRDNALKASPPSSVLVMREFWTALSQSHSQKWESLLRLARGTRPSGWLVALRSTKRGAISVDWLGPVYSVLGIAMSLCVAFWAEASSLLRNA